MAAAALAAGLAVMLAAAAVLRPAHPAVRRLAPAGSRTPVRAVRPRTQRLAESLGRRFPGAVESSAAALSASGGDLEAAARLAGMRVGAAASGAVLGAAAGRAAIVMAPLLAGAGWWVPVRRVRAEGRARSRAVAAALPDAIDLLAACTLGGLGLTVALERVAEHTGGLLGDELRRLLRSLEVGVAQEDALRALQERHPSEELRLVTSHLITAARFGAPVAASLLEVASDLRAARRRGAEEESRKAPVKMLFPLVFLILPAYMCVAVIPLLIDIFRTVRF